MEKRTFINNSLDGTVKEILNKIIIPHKIYRDDNKIEIETINPTAFISIIYKNEKDRDIDYTELESKIYHLIKVA